MTSSYQKNSAEEDDVDQLRTGSRVTMVRHESVFIPLRGVAGVEHTPSGIQIPPCTHTISRTDFNLMEGGVSATTAKAPD